MKMLWVSNDELTKCRSVYGGIPPNKTRVEPKDFELEDESKALLKGGFHYGKNMRSVIYVPPRPLMNHGVHRCMNPDKPSEWA